MYRFIIFGLIFFNTIILNAQDSSKFEIGVYSTINRSSLNNKNYLGVCLDMYLPYVFNMKDFSPITGYEFNVKWSYYVLKGLNISSGINYANKGFKGIFVYFKTTQITRIEYLGVPVLFGYTFLKEEKFSPYINVGLIVNNFLSLKKDGNRTGYIDNSMFLLVEKNINIGMKYAVTKNIDLDLAFSYKESFEKQFTCRYITTFLNIGGSLGIVYKL